MFNSKSQVFILLILISFIFACAGRQPNPVTTYQYGDEKKPCPHLRAEISQIDTDILMKMHEGSGRRSKNTAWGVVGAVVFWPALFALDLSKADVVELDALRKRRNNLLLISSDKECGFENLKEVKDLKEYAAQVKAEKEVEKSKKPIEE